MPAVSPSRFSQRRISGSANGAAGVVDVFPVTPGIQAALGTPTQEIFRYPSGRPMFWVTDPFTPEAGLQLLPEGISPRTLSRRLGLIVPAYVQVLEDVVGGLGGQFIPVDSRPRRRRMNPANHRATRRAIRRFGLAHDHFKKLFKVVRRAQKVTKKGGKKKR